MTTEIENQATKSWMETPPLAPPLRRAANEFVEKQVWLETLANPLQHWLKSLSGKPHCAKLKNFLYGTAFGHPLHPGLTDVPLGSWGATLLCDILWLLSKKPAMASAADVTLIFGSVGAVASAVTGLADWSETDADARRMGLMHGLLNAIALVGNLTSLGLRLASKRKTGITLSGLSYALSLIAAYLGGELTFAKGIGINHVAWEAGPDNFVPVISLANLPKQQLTRVDAAGMPVVLWREGDHIAALAATCSHQGGPLDEGTCQNGQVTCPWHGSTFRLDDGTVTNGPAVFVQPTFAVRVRNNKVEVRRLEHA